MFMKKIAFALVLTVLIGITVILYNSARQGVDHDTDFDDPNNPNNNDNQASDEDAFIVLDLDNYRDYLSLELVNVSEQEGMSIYVLNISESQGFVLDFEIRVDLTYDYLNVRCNYGLYNQFESRIVQQSVLTEFQAFMFETEGDPTCEIDDVVYFSKPENLTMTVVRISGKIRE